MKMIMEKEDPDLVVITGDAVTGSSWDGTEGWYAR